jgi:hypothetical protein
MEVRSLSAVHRGGFAAAALARILLEFRAWAEDATRERLRYSARELSQEILECAERADPHSAREIRKLFGLE